MDQHSIRDMREEALLSGRGAKSLVSVEPDMKLQEVVETLFNKKCSMAPIVTVDSESGRVGWPLRLFWSLWFFPPLNLDPCHY